MFSAGSILAIVLIVFWVVVMNTVQSLGFLIFIITSVLTYKIFFKNVEEFKNGISYFFTPTFFGLLNHETKENLPGEGKFMVWFSLNFIVAYLANDIFS